MIEIRSIYHPVGQGLFFSSKIIVGEQEFNFVYDCGGSLKEERWKKVMDDYIKTLPLTNNEGNEKKRKLDLLIISHFHKDHINGLETLLERVKLNTVILPYLSPLELLLYAIVNAEFLDRPHLRFLLNPIQYLKEKAVEEIILIARGDESDEGIGEFSLPENPERPNLENPFDIKNLGKDELNKKIEKKFEEDGWNILLEDNNKGITLKSYHGYALLFGVYVFGFFNVRNSIDDFEIKINDFKNCLLRKFNKPDIKKFYIYLRDNIDKVINELKKSRNNKFAQCYKKAFGNDKLNLTSLIVYNQLLKNYVKIKINQRVCHLFPPPFWRWCCDFYYNAFYNVKYTYAHFLTGDSELKKTKIMKEFLTYYENVLDKSLFFLLPHHGSEDNWNKNLLEELPNNEFFIASAGLNNRYNHPSCSVFADILSEDRIPIFVNEKNWLLVIVQ